jgi:hypothetical protein
MKRGICDRQPARGLPPQVEQHRLRRLPIGQTVQDRSTSTEATTSGGIDGRPRPVENRSVNIDAGNNANRCAARNANTLPAGSR